MNNVVRRITYFAVAAIFGALALFALRGPQGIPALMEKRRAIRAMEEQNAQLEQQIETKQKYIEKLKHSAAEQEKEVRENLNLQRKGDVTLMLPEGSK